MSNTFEKAAKIRTQYQRDVERIRSDKHLSTQGKAARLAEAWTKASGEIQALRQEHATEREAERQRLRSAAFELKIPAGASEGEKAMIRLNFRDALDRAERITVPRDALTLLSRAKQAGDEHLAQAVAQRAYEQGWSDVLNAHLEAFPAQGRRVEALYDFEQRHNSTEGRFEASVSLSIPERPQGAAPDVPGTAPAASSTTA